MEKEEGKVIHCDVFLGSEDLRMVYPNNRTLFREKQNV